MVGIKAVNDDNEIMMITTEGIIIQLRMQDISILSRITSGVKMMNLDEGIKVAQIAKVRAKVDNMEDPGEEKVSEADEKAVETDEKSQVQTDLS